MRVLNIVEDAYRATLEEQDDPALWIVHAIRGVGAEVAVLLRGNAVNYAVKAQDASGLAFGGQRQTQPPRVGEDVAGLIAKGVKVYIVEEDLAERGVGRGELIDGLDQIARAEIADLLGAFDGVWHW